MASMKGFKQLFTKNTKPDASPMPPAQASVQPEETRKAYNDRLFKHIAENFSRQVQKDAAPQG